MILPDTSVWIEHFRRRGHPLSDLLHERRVVVHPHVIGELACGHLPRRADALAGLKDLPATQCASEEEALGFIEHHDLAGRGIGYIDVHLLASVVLQPGARLWTLDARVAAVARELAIDFTPE